MSLINLGQTGESREMPTIIWQRWSGYLIWVGLGLVGGAAGVALSLAAVIFTQIFLLPTTVFSPGMIPLTIVATALSGGASWLLGRLVYQFFPRLVRNSPEQAMQVILMVGVLASLLQTFLFMQGL